MRNKRAAVTARWPPRDQAGRNVADVIAAPLEQADLALLALAADHEARIDALEAAPPAATQATILKIASLRG